jgi:hypothetical protein
MMQSKTAPKPAQKPAPSQQVRQAITLELVHAITPSETKAEQMSAAFGLEPVDHGAIREKIEEHVVRVANELRDNLNDKAMAIFLQRVVRGARPEQPPDQRRARRGPRRCGRLRE